MAGMTEKDYYAILEVDEKATTEEIRKAFQKKARKLHPDVNKEPDAEERFKEVSEAYAVLSDAEKRQRYDAMRSGVPFAGGGGYSGGYPGGGYGQGSPFGDGFPFGGAWSTRTQRSSRSYHPRAGADVTVEVDLDADTAKAGAKRGFTYQRYVTCDVCGGSGSVEHAHATTCPTCRGAKRIRVDLGGLGLFGLGYMEVTCPECEGTGKVVADPCSACGGSGRTISASEIVVDIPEDSHDGDEVRVAGKGNAGTNGREAGDFILEVHVAEERLAPQQEAYLRLAGFGVPLVVLGLLRGGISSMTLIGGVVLILGIVMAARFGVRGNRRWLTSAATAIVGGACTGIIVGLVLYFSGPLLAMMWPLIIVVLMVSMLSRRSG